MDGKFYRELVEMADAARLALSQFEETGNSLEGSLFRPLSALVASCLQGRDLEPSIAIDVGPRRKSDLLAAIIALNDGSYHGRPTFNPRKREAIHTIRELAAAVLKEKEESEARGATLPPRSRGKVDFVGQDRIEELRSIRSERFDLQRLIRLCEELNFANHHECHMTKAMLVRALMDLVPPIFGAEAFAQLASYPGVSKSFKEVIKRSGVLRAIGDLQLHQQIRQREVLPTAAQVDCQNEIDLVLAEVVRILK